MTRPPSRYTQKIRAKRIELDYFKRPHFLRDLKRWLSIGLPVLAALWLGFYAIRGDQRIYTSGPVSTAHAMFGTQCGECHVPAPSSGGGAVATATAAPVAADAPAGATKHGFFIRVSDQACSACHAGPIHHDNQVVSPTCSSCHLEHKGRVELAGLADHYCTQCHTGLATKDGTPSVFAAKVTSFTRDHPEFAVNVREKDGVKRVRLDKTAELKDTAQIKLNHQKHVKIGLKGVDDVQKLSGMRGLVQGKDGLGLGCTYCHETDESRANMKPVAFARHCVACHPLDFDGRFPDAVTPHDTPALVHAYLRTTFLEAFEQCKALPTGAAAQQPEAAKARKQCEDLELAKAAEPESPRGRRGGGDAEPPKTEAPASDSPRGSRLRGGGGGSGDASAGGESIGARRARADVLAPAARGADADSPRGSRLGRGGSAPAAPPASEPAADAPRGRRGASDDAAASDSPRGRRGRGDAAEESSSDRPRGRRGGDDATPTAKADTGPAALDWVASQLPGIEKVVFKQKCESCHVPDESTAGAVPTYKRTAIPVRWLPHSVFDHGAHRTVTCTECHKAAASKETTDVLLPSATVCRECHRPAGGARAGCVECHLYHDKAKDRDLNGPFTIPHMVKGKSR